MDYLWQILAFFSKYDQHKILQIFQSKKFNRQEISLKLSSAELNLHENLKNEYGWQKVDNNDISDFSCFFPLNNK